MTSLDDPDPRFVVDAFEPASLAVRRAGGLASRVEAARCELACCRACPRDCAVDRLRGERGVCGTGRRAVVSSASAHFGEEACLSGRRGSGTIFFCLCNLRCVFCQNWQISQTPSGIECDAEEIAGLALGLQEAGCHNLNLITPEHVVPQVVEAIAIAVQRGLRIPIVYNTSGYDALSSLRLLDGLIDVYVPDFKFWDPESARLLCNAADYPERTREAIREMHRQVGPLCFDRQGVAVRGLLVRHLVMPGQTDQPRSIFEWLARELSRDTFVNIMWQYCPPYTVPDFLESYDAIDRVTTRAEVRAAYEAARDAGLWRFAEPG